MVRNLAFPASDITILLDGLGIDVLLRAIEKALGGPSPDLIVQVRWYNGASLVQSAHCFCRALGHSKTSR